MEKVNGLKVILRVKETTFYNLYHGGTLLLYY